MPLACIRNNVPCNLTESGRWAHRGDWRVVYFPNDRSSEAGAARAGHSSGRRGRSSTWGRRPRDSGSFGKDGGLGRVPLGCLMGAECSVGALGVSVIAASTRMVGDGDASTPTADQMAIAASRRVMVHGDASTPSADQMASFPIHPGRWLKITS